MKMEHTTVLNGARERKSRGQALVEFALVAPMLFLLLLGVFEGGRFVLYMEALNNAAREGARYAIVHGARGTPQSGPLPDGVDEKADYDEVGDDIRQRVREAAIGLLVEDSLEIPEICWLTPAEKIVPIRDVTDCSHGHNGHGSPVTVWVDYSYDTILDQMLGVDFLPTIELSAETTLVVNN